jgi:hypothetical protein
MSIRIRRTLSVAAPAALVALALMVWSFFDARPLVSVLALTIGQGLATASFVSFVLVVVTDLRRARVFPHDESDRRSSLPPAPRKGDGG